MPPSSGKVLIKDAERPMPLSQGGMILSGDCDIYAIVASGSIYLGDSSVRLSLVNGVPLANGDSYKIPRGEDLRNWFIAGAVNDGVSFLTVQ